MTRYEILNAAGSGCWNHGSCPCDWVDQLLRVVFGTEEGVEYDEVRAVYCVSHIMNCMREAGVLRGPDCEPEGATGPGLMADGA